MKISPKRAVTIALLPVAVLLLSGCGSPAAPKSSSSAPTTGQNVPQSTSQASSDAPKAPAVAATPQQPALEPLPADDKQAIDTELSNIDKELKTTDNTVKSTDLSNANLGL